MILVLVYTYITRNIKFPNVPGGGVSQKSAKEGPHLLNEENELFVLLIYFGSHQCRNGSSTGVRHLILPSPSLLFQRHYY